MNLIFEICGIWSCDKLLEKNGKLEEEKSMWTFKTVKILNHKYIKLLKHQIENYNIMKILKIVKHLSVKIHKCENTLGVKK